MAGDCYREVTICDLAASDVQGRLLLLSHDISEWCNMNIKNFRTSLLYDQRLTEELLRLYRTNPEWVRFVNIDDNRYTARSVEDTYIKMLATTAVDYFSLHAASVFLGQGPKVFCPSVEQCKALENVEINLSLADYEQPYETLLVVADYPPFNSALCHFRKSIPMLNIVLNSEGRQYDITTTIVSVKKDIEDAVTKYDPDCRFTDAAMLLMRVAINSCLALVNYGHHSKYLFPKEIESDQRLAREKTERGERARKRLSLAVQQVSFSQDIRLHSVSSMHESSGSGREISPHWRRGHWRMQACGASRSNRKRIFIKPMMIKQYLFTGDVANTTAVYR